MRKMASRSGKMAVTVDNQPIKTPVSDQNSRDDGDQRAPVANQKITTDGYLSKKKSTFKITSVTKNSRGGSGEVTIADADVDSLDDLDETVESHTEDASSEILDNSKYDDGVDQFSPLDESIGHESELTSGKENKEKSDVHSTRFKVVKIETKEPFRRGRWTCRDSLDTPVGEKSETKLNEEKDRNSGNSSACSSVNYVEGVDDPAKNPLSTASFPNIDQTNENQVEKSHVQVPGASLAQQMPGQNSTQIPWKDGQMQNHIAQDGQYSIQPNPTNPTFNQMPLVGMTDPNLPSSMSAQFQQQMQLGVNGSISSSQNQQYTALHMSNIAPMSGQQNIPLQQGHTMLPASNHAPLAPTPGSIPMQTLQETSDHSKVGISSAVSEYPNSSVDPNSITVTSSNSNDTHTNIVMSDQGRQPPTTLTTQVVQDSEKLNANQTAQNITSPKENSDTKNLDTVPSHPYISSSQNNPGATEQKNKDSTTAGSKSMTQSSSEIQTLQSQGATPILTPSVVAEVVGGIASPTEVDER